MQRHFLWLALLINGCCAGTCSFAQNFDGACLLTTTNMQWSGVAVSPTEILTVAHHGLQVGSEVRADFPENGHGGTTRVSVKTRVKKIHKLADISLLEYTSPEWACIKQYRLVAENPFTKPGRKVKINGYVNAMPRVADVSFERGDTKVDEILVNQFRGKAVSGMSGAPALIGDTLVGIQFGGGDTVIHCVAVKTIQEFLD